MFFEFDGYEIMFVLFVSFLGVWGLGLVLVGEVDDGLFVGLEVYVYGCWVYLL